jgi:hypothetical protein
LNVSAPLDGPPSALEFALVVKAIRPRPQGIDHVRAMDRDEFCLGQNGGC